MFAIINPSFLELINIWLDTSPCRYRTPFVSAPRRIRHFGAHIYHLLVLFLYFGIADDNIFLKGCPWPYLCSARRAKRAQANKREEAPGEESYRDSSINLSVALLIPYLHFAVVCLPQTNPMSQDMLHNFWRARAKQTGLQGSGDTRRSTITFLLCNLFDSGSTLSSELLPTRLQHSASPSKASLTANRISGGHRVHVGFPVAAASHLLLHLMTAVPLAFLLLGLIVLVVSGGLGRRRTWVVHLFVYGL